MIPQTRSSIDASQRLLDSTRYQIAASRRLLRRKFGFGLAGGSEGTAMPSLPNPLPPTGHEHFAGLVCPDCSGNIVVRRERDNIAFQCRVGHEYSTKELLLSKEEALEASAWHTIFAYEELSSLLRDLAAQDLDGDFGRETCRARAALAEEQAIRLRELLDSDRPLGATESNDC